MADRPYRVAVVGSGPAGFYAVGALLASDEPRFEVDLFERLPTPWGLASGFVAMAVTWLEAWRYARRPGRMFVIPADEGPAQVDDAPVEDLQMRRRGPLVQLAWRQQGRRHWRLFWPDTLPQAQARELRLAVRAHCISRSPPAVAP